MSAFVSRDGYLLVALPLPFHETQKLGSTFSYTPVMKQFGDPSEALSLTGILSGWAHSGLSA